MKTEAARRSYEEQRYAGQYGGFGQQQQQHYSQQQANATWEEAFKDVSSSPKETQMKQKEALLLLLYL